MNLIDPELTPRSVAARIDLMGWPALDGLRVQLVGRMGMVAEAPGIRLQPTPIAHAKPGGQEPRAIPWCSCGHASLRDHHIDDIARSVAQDIHRGDERPVKFRGALVRAAQALWVVGHRPIATPHDPSVDDAGVDRNERIITEYVGFSPETVSGLESSRAGWVSPEHVRRLRRRNEKHAETGEDGPPVEEMRQQALQLYYGEHPHTYRSIGALLGVAHTTVMRWCSPAEHENAA